MTPTKKTSIDRLRDLADEDRMTGRAVEWLEDLGDASELAQLLSDFVEAVSEATEAVDSWQNAEGGEDKRDAREEAIAAVARLIDAWDSVSCTDVPEAISSLILSAGWTDEERS